MSEQNYITEMLELKDNNINLSFGFLRNSKELYLLILKNVYF